MKRNATLDYARFLAAVGIIVFHVGTVGGSIGYAALPFFLMLLVVLAFSSAEHLGFKDYMRGRASRLLVPWAMWSLVYGALKLAEVALTDATLPSEFSSWMLLTGPSIHLWFMPFAFSASLLIWPLAGFVALFSDRWRGIFAAVGVTLAVLLITMLSGITTAPPFAQWFFALPAVAFGAGIGCLLGASNLAGIVTLYTAALAVGVWAAGWPNGSSQLVIASAALSICIALPTRTRPVASWLADISVTLYLAHPLVVAVLLRLTPLQDGSLELAGFVVAGTILLAALLRGKQVRAFNPFSSQGTQS